MKTLLLYFIGVMLLCISAIAGLQIEPGNRSDLKDEAVGSLVSNLVAAINTNKEEAILLMLHPECSKQKNDKDVTLFLKFVLNHRIPVTYKWRAATIKNDSASLACNSFIVMPAYCVDVFWSAPTPKDPHHQECLSIMCVRQGDTLLIVTYMNDYLKKKLQPLNKASEAVPCPES